jgi:hypothetical protein
MQPPANDFKARHARPEGIDDLITGKKDKLRVQFESLFYSWATTWKFGYTSETNTWATGDAWNQLVAMGEPIGVFIAEKLSKTPMTCLPLLQLWNKIYDDNPNVPKYIWTITGNKVEVQRIPPVNTS